MTPSNTSLLIQFIENITIIVLQDVNKDVCWDLVSLGNVIGLHFPHQIIQINPFLIQSDLIRCLIKEVLRFDSVQIDSRPLHLPTG